MKNWRNIFAGGLIAILGGTQIARAADDGPRATIDAGILAGKIDETGVRVFKGIPFAAAPVGNLRWREPQPAAPWTGVRDAVDFGDRCQQGAFPAFRPIGGSGMSENCLFLNVWAEPNSQKRPVLVWISGGGFGYGFSNQAWYDGGAFAKKGLVFVSLNYRVGVMGLLAHPELTSESPDKSSGNYAILDQIAALQWVKRNIASFGGDPENVTIFGESAGSISVNILTASPLAKGLFKRAIGDSGAALGTTVDTLPVRPLEWEEKRGNAFAEAAGARSISELRATPAAQLVDLGEKAPGYLFEPGQFAPNIDGHLLVETPEQTFARGAQNNVDLIAGWNLNEANIFIATSLRRGRCKPDWAGIQTVDAFTAQARRTFGAASAEFLQLYPHSNDVEAKASAEFVAGDSIINYSSWKWADLQKRSGKTAVYAYLFSKKPPSESPLGIPTHAAEIPYAFDNLEKLKWSWDGNDPNVAHIMSSYYANFAKTGDPNGPALPEWPAYDPARPRRIVFNENGAEAADMDVGRLKFLDGHRSVGPWCPDIR